MGTYRKGNTKKMKIILINIILFFSVSQCKNLTISPLFYTSYQPLGGTWSVEENDIFLGGWGIIGKYNNDNFNIELDFYNNRFFGITHKPNSFSKEQGLSWWKAVDSANNSDNDTYDFDIANIKMTYSNNDYELFLGKFNRHWGPGESSLTISNKSPSFSQFGFNWNVNSNIKFEYFHGTLKSLVIDSLNIDYYNQILGSKNPNLNRFIAAHRIDFKISPNITLGASEMVVYGVRNMDMMYTVPFIPFWSLQHYLGDFDNIQLSFDFNWKINQKINLYGAFLIDEWSPSLTFDENERNWFAYQLGSRSKNLFINDDYIIIEYTWTDHRIYRHRFEINDYYNHGQPLGFWAGPHAEELLLNYSFEKFDFLFDFKYSNSKRGELTEDMLENQYTNENSDFERYSNIYESISLLEITVNKSIYKGLNIHLGFNVIDWKNGNFDPYETLSNDNLKTVNKKSYFVGLSYNFDINKQKAFINEKSIQVKYD